MLVCLNKFLIKYCLPLAMEQFPMTVCKEGATKLLLFEMVEHKIFEVTRELTKRSTAELFACVATYCLKICNMIAKIGRGLTPRVLALIPEVHIKRP